MTTYHYEDETGFEEPLSDAANLEEAIELAKASCLRGDWGDDGAVIGVWVVEKDEVGEEIDRTAIEVEIPSAHENLIARATDGNDRSCGNNPDDHDWTSEGEGGCDRNPGAWSDGGTALVITAHCRCCGLHRKVRTTGSQRNPGDHDTVEYRMPNTWCDGCECEVCKCRESTITKVNIYAIDGRWYYAAWTGSESDHSDEIPDAESEADAREWARAEFPAASIKVVDGNA